MGHRIQTIKKHTLSRKLKLKFTTSTTPSCILSTIKPNNLDPGKAPCPERTATCPLCCYVVAASKAWLAIILMVKHPMGAQDMQ